MRSSILKIDMAASVANLIAFNLLKVGSKTPALTLSCTVPSNNSRPNLEGSGQEGSDRDKPGIVFLFGVLLRGHM